MTHDPILRLLGLAKRAGRLEAGEEPVGAVCRSHQARLVLAACDAAPNTCRRAAHFSQAGNVLWLEVPFTKAELGCAVGRSSCALLALTDAGFAAAVAEKLAARDQEAYASAAGQLREKADRTLQRQREQRRHEKKLRQGKAPPPLPPQRGKPRPAKARRRTQSGGAPNTPESGQPHRNPGGPGGRRLTGKLRHS